MGVTACGKTTIGQTIATRLEAGFIEGDALHPPANIAKMRNGTPLTDADRLPWLDTLAHAMRAATGTCVTSCSALKRAYRDRIIRKAGAPVFYVYLQGSPDLIGCRMAGRRDHFMARGLLESQFAALEEPRDDEWHVTIPIDQHQDAIVATALEAIET